MVGLGEKKGQPRSGPRGGEEKTPRLGSRSARACEASEASVKGNFGRPKGDLSKTSNVG